MQFYPSSAHAVQVRERGRTQFAVNVPCVQVEPWHAGFDQRWDYGWRSSSQLDFLLNSIMKLENTKNRVFFKAGGNNFDLYFALFCSPECRWCDLWGSRAAIQKNVTQADNPAAEEWCPTIVGPWLPQDRPFLHHHVMFSFTFIALVWRIDG